LELLKTTKVEDLVDKNQKLVTVYFDDDVGAALNRLSGANVHSALIIHSNKPHEVFGFVDVWDILYHLIDVHSTSGDFIQLKWEALHFTRIPTYSVSNASQMDPYVTVPRNQNIFETIKLFSEGIHRSAVIENSHVMNIISQSDIARWLAGIATTMGPILSQSLSEIGLSSLGVIKKTWVVDEDYSVIQTLMKMKEYKVSGVPVVSKAGKILANFSNTDLVGLSESNWSWITFPILEYLKKINGGVPKTPVTCTIDDPLGTLLTKYSFHKIQRVYLVSEQNEPVGVITLTDIMKFIKDRL
jgi:predicted transcriptional regulator